MMTVRKSLCSATLAVSLTVVAAAGAAAFPVPDTGQNRCYDNTAEIPCPAPGEPFYGQDASYTINPPSYTKLGAGGVELDAAATIDDGWLMTRDNVTGLVWELPVNDPNDPLMDLSTQLSWCAPDPNAFGCTAGLVNYLNENVFGGHDDWRLPATDELVSLVDFGNGSPAIDTTFFPFVSGGSYWTGDPQVRVDSDDNAWTVLFTVPLTNPVAPGTVSPVSTGAWSGMYAKAVRGGVTTHQFRDNGDGTVTDLATGLVWQQQPAAVTYSWQEALAAAEAAELAGFTDWRLPTIKELLSLVDRSRREPALDTDVFPDDRWWSYWSSTTYAAAPEQAWQVDFLVGSSQNKGKDQSASVRLVRSPVRAGDFSGDGAVGLADAIVVLQVLAGDSRVALNPGAAVTDHQRPGIGDAVFVLRKLAQ